MKSWSHGCDLCVQCRLPLSEGICIITSSTMLSLTVVLAHLYYDMITVRET